MTLTKRQETQVYILGEDKMFAEKGLTKGINGWNRRLEEDHRGDDNYNPFYAVSYGMSHSIYQSQDIVRNLQDFGVLYVQRGI